MLQTNLDTALQTPMCRYWGIKQEQKFNHIGSAIALLYLVQYEREYGKINIVHERLMGHLRNLITGGREPICDCQHYWSYPIVASAIALAKYTDSIWSELSENDIERFDLLMRSWVVSSNWMMNDVNFYSTSLSLAGDVNKKWGPNYRISLLGPIIAGAIYFGGSDAIDNILVSYDYEREIGLMRQFGFTNMLEIWNKDSIVVNNIRYPSIQEMVTFGGPAHVRENQYGEIVIFRGGQGQGVCIPFLFEGIRAGDIALIDKVLEHCYPEIAVTNHSEDMGDGTYKAYILDGTDSPVKGQMGMMREFEGQDGLGLRSDAHYCQMDYIMICALALLLKNTGRWAPNEKNVARMKIGNSDLEYKLAHGYVSYALGLQKVVKENPIMGYNMAKEIWSNM